MSIEAASPEVAAVEVAAAVAAADEVTEALLLTARPSLMETEHLLLVPLPGAAEGAPALAYGSGVRLRRAGAAHAGRRGAGTRACCPSARSAGDHHVLAAARRARARVHADLRPHVLHAGNLR